MPDADDDEVLHAQVAELEEAVDGLAAMLRSMTDVRVAVLVETVGMGELSTYELARAEATRLLSWAGLTRAILDANEPERTPGGGVRVGVLVGATTLDPDTAVRGACAAWTGRRWSAPQPGTVAEHRFAFWCAEPAPFHGPSRIEIHAAPGLAVVTERQRRELLDDPDPDDGRT